MQEVKLFVLPVPRVSVQGRSNYTFKYGDGTEIPSGRTFARGVEKIYAFAGTKDGQKVVSGLEELIDNPYYEQEFNKVPQDIAMGSEWVDKFNLIKTREKIPLQTFYEILDNQVEGVYTTTKSGVTMATGMGNANSVKNWVPTFLENFRIYLQDNTNFFTNQTSRGRLAIQLLKNHPKIAINKESININVHDFYIAVEDEALMERSGKRNKVMEAITALTNLKKKLETEPFLLYQLAVTLGIIKGPVSRMVVSDELDSFIWESKKTQFGTQEQRIDAFERLLPWTENVDGLDKLYIKYALKQAINERVILIDKGAYIWPKQRGIDNLYNLGTNEKGVATFFYNELPKAKANLESHLKSLEEELKVKGVQIRE